MAKGNRTTGGNRGHGAYMYAKRESCTCELCLAALSKRKEYMRLWKQNKVALLEAGLLEVDHGTSRAYTFGCRCDVCVKGKAVRRKPWTLKLYNITQDEYDEQWERQGGICPVCENALDPLKAHIDHGHETQSFRGILCSGCNTGLGKLGDNIAGLERAIRYLSNTY